MGDVTPRVNSARLGEYIGRTVRLVCKVEHVSIPSSSLNSAEPQDSLSSSKAKDLSVIAPATDMGQVEVKMTMVCIPFFLLGMILKQ